MTPQCLFQTAMETNWQHRLLPEKKMNHILEMTAFPSTANKTSPEDKFRHTCLRLRKMNRIHSSIITRGKWDTKIDLIQTHFLKDHLYFKDFIISSHHTTEIGTKQRSKSWSPYISGFNYQESCTYNSITECTHIKLYFEYFALFREEVCVEGADISPGRKKGNTPSPSPKIPCFRAVYILICRVENMQVCADLKVAHGYDTTFKLFWEYRMEGALWQNT